MEKSKVYFTNLRAKNNDNLQHQRRSADDPHHRSAEPAQREKATHRAERDDKAERQRADQRDRKQF